MRESRIEPKSLLILSLSLSMSSGLNINYTKLSLQNKKEGVGSIIQLLVHYAFIGHNFSGHHPKCIPHSLLPLCTRTGALELHDL